jgi:peptidoglycan DL-endopeptidase CwlO
MKNLQNSVLTVTMAVGLAITGLSPAHASAPTTTSTTITQEQPDTNVPETISAAPTAKISFDKTPITTSAAPSVDVSVETVQPQSSESVSTVTTTPAAQAAPAPAPAAPARVIPASQPTQTTGHGARSAVASAALAQLGVAQDCTALVTNSLRAIGINFHGWPADYMSLGHTVSEAAAQPGDLIYYANGGTGVAHIAVYIGNGQAVHGGWNGGTTAVASAHIGSGPVFIRIG